jgi:hypothetical protein
MVPYIVLKLLPVVDDMCVSQVSHLSDDAILYVETIHNLAILVRVSEHRNGINFILHTVKIYKVL